MATANTPLSVVSSESATATAPANVKRVRIGELLVQCGAMTDVDVERVLSAQEASGERFGEMAVRLGLIRRQDIDAAFIHDVEFPLSIAASPAPPSPSLVSLYQGNSPAAESIRTLRAELLARWYQRRPVWPALAITGVERGEGRSFVAANLAVAFAQMGRRTLLVDADLRNPSQQHLFNLQNRFGLAGILAGNAGLGEICTIDAVPGLAVLVSGEVPKNAQDLISRDWLPMLLRTLVQRFDVVLLDTPAYAECADAQLLAGHARGAVVVSQRDQTRRRLLTAFRGALQAAGTEVLGIAYNDR